MLEAAKGKEGAAAVVCARGGGEQGGRGRGVAALPTERVCKTGEGGSRRRRRAVNASRCANRAGTPSPTRSRMEPRLKWASDCRQGAQEGRLLLGVTHQSRGRAHAPASAHPASPPLRRPPPLDLRAQRSPRGPRAARAGLRRRRPPVQADVATQADGDGVGGWMTRRDRERGGAFSAANQ